MDSEGHHDDHRPVRQVYTGVGRFVVCREVSGENCDREMAADAEHCGIEAHARLVPHGIRRGVPLFRERRVARKPRLIVEEDFDIVSAPDGDDVASGDVIETRMGPIDPSAIWVSLDVQRDATAYHGLTPDEAIDNIRTVIRHAAERGSFWQTRGGFHRFLWFGYHVVVTPDLGTAVRYTTDHFERTPREVEAGVKSRFKKRSKGRPAPSAHRPVPVDLCPGLVVDGHVSNVVNFGVFVDIGECDALLHKSRIGSSAEHLRECVSIGEKVTVEVLKVDLEGQRVELAFAGARPAWAGLDPDMAATCEVPPDGGG